MGGKINVESQFGKGSIFMVTIPQRIGKIVRPLTDTQVLNTAEIMEKASEKQIDYANKTLLIVDDNKLNIKVARRSVEPLNFKKIDECYNGKECVDKIKAGSTYDVILMDIMMPIMSGETAIKELQKLDSFHTPVIALTADALVGAEEKYKEIGFASYIAKPFTKDQIKIKLDKLFSSSFDEKISKRLSYVEESSKSPWKNVPAYMIGSSDAEILPIQKGKIKSSKTNSTDCLSQNGVNFERSVALFGDEKMYHNVLENWYHHCREKWHKLEICKDKNDMESYTACVHILKSHAKYLGFTDFATLSYEHEMKSRENDFLYIKSHFDELRLSFEKMVSIMTDYLY